MGLPITPEEVAALSVDERLDLIDMIWDTLDENDFELTDAQKAELDRRLEAYHADPGAGSSWSEVKARLLGDANGRS